MKLATFLVLVTLQASAADHWVATWETAPGGPAPNARSYKDQTLREIVHTTVSGTAVRVRLSNVYGTLPLSIGAAHIAIRRATSSITPASDRPLTFGGRPAVSIPTGALVVSDPVKLDVPAQSDLAVSLYLPSETAVETAHRNAFQTNYVAPGDATASADLPSSATTMNSWPFLVGVDLARPAKTEAIVAFGDSITDGAGSTLDANHRWPDALAQRLISSKRPIAVLNAGISGNRVLHNGAGPLTYSGPSLLTRFNHDVLAEPGVKYVILFEGINDIGVPGTAVAPASEEVTPADIIAGLRQIAERAHEQDLRIFVGTLTPFEGTRIAGYFTPDRELKRQEVNQGIRTGQGFDAVIDFDKIVCDPDHPARILPRYDSGDHLHLSDAGYQAMAAAIDLTLFKK